MPLPIAAGHPTLLITKAAFERAQFTRAAFDERLGLTDEEFRVEGGLIVIGPIFDEAAFDGVLQELEGAGLEYFDDYFELSGNWPAWVAMFAGGADQRPR